MTFIIDCIFCSYNLFFTNLICNFNIFVYMEFKKIIIQLTKLFNSICVLIELQKMNMYKTKLFILIT